MYIDPNVGGVLFQVFAAIFAAVNGIVLVFSRQIRSGITRIRRLFLSSKSEGLQPKTSKPRNNRYVGHSIAENCSPEQKG